VVYGVVGHKTHAKLTLLLRREDGGLRRYAHLGTGNYHPRTARIYEDFGMFTADPDICADVNEVFRRLTGAGHAVPLRQLLQAPFTLAEHVMQAIRFEADTARAGRRAYIAAKVNSLLEPKLIEALYEASQAGVKIDLIVRGVCALRPGVPGLSDNIRVRSVIGRFLEHSRIYHFHADGANEVWLASADWMGRNFPKNDFFTILSTKNILYYDDEYGALVALDMMYNMPVKAKMSGSAGSNSNNKVSGPR
jgi:polyphosphate kinase